MSGRAAVCGQPISLRGRLVATSNLASGNAAAAINLRRCRFRGLGIGRDWRRSVESDTSCLSAPRTFYLRVPTKAHPYSFDTLSDPYRGLAQQNALPMSSVPVLLYSRKVTFT